MRHALLWTSWIAATLAACGGEEAPAPAPTEAAESACSLSRDALPGKTFVRQLKGDGDKWDADVMARLRFEGTADAIKAKYSVRSLASVYDYTCGAPAADAKDGEFTCLQDNPDLLEFCRALHFNAGACDADQVAKVVGVPAPTPEIEAAVAKVNGELKKLKAAELEKMKLAYNSPNVQLRGILKVKFKTKDECRLSVSDLYENFSNGARYEQENLVGKGARFAETGENLVFDDCRDMQNLVASADPAAKLKPGQSQREWAVGDNATVRYAGTNDLKPEAGCTYTMDTAFGYKVLGAAVPVSAGADGKLDWSFQRGISTAGRQVAHLTRYKACNGAAAQKIDTSCQVLEVR